MSTDHSTPMEGPSAQTSAPTGVMRATRHYENFMLELEWKHLRKGGNAGLFAQTSVERARADVEAGPREAEKNRLSLTV